MTALTNIHFLNMHEPVGLCKHPEASGEEHEELSDSAPVMATSKTLHNSTQSARIALADQSKKSKHHKQAAHGMIWNETFWKNLFNSLMPVVSYGYFCDPRLAQRFNES